MKLKAKAPARKKRDVAVEDPVADEAEAAEGATGEVIDRPDGFYWRSPDGRREEGPFETSELARDDMDAADAPELGSVETLREAESEIGLADWIDPETGQPAEGMSPPRLSEE